MKNLLYLALFIVLFSSCTGSLGKKPAITNDYEKLQNVINLIQNYYYDHTIQIDSSLINAKNLSKEDINLEIQKLMNSLDKYSIYINNSNLNNKDSKNMNITITSKIINKGILYIKLPYFYHQASLDIEKIINKNKNQIESLILDLRDNSGGSLKEAVKTVDLFIDKGKIVSVVKRDKHLTREYFATKKTIFNKTMMVLVNEKTASSAEIVSGALQDSKAATLIGTETFGKGTIQSLIYITKDKKEAIKLTVGQYFLSGNRSMKNKIYPDIYISNTLLDDLQLDYAVSFLNNVN